MSEFFLILKFLLRFLEIYFERRSQIKQNNLNETEILKLSVLAIEKLRSDLIKDSKDAVTNEEWLEKSLSEVASSYTVQEANPSAETSNEHGPHRKSDRHSPPKSNPDQQ